MREIESSEFDKTQEDDIEGPIDFAKAKKLNTDGSTCDAYVARHHHRAVFVKRLKAEFRYSPRHLTAFEKEFETGFRLEHPALPRYIEFHGDYMLINYVNGSTLASLIQEHDSWLGNPENVRKMLTELVDAIDYLHQNGVVHSDIKADNIMLRNGERQAMLIDLDKAYTDWLDDTAGAAARYGLDSSETGNPDIDWRGLGMMLESMSAAGIQVDRFRKFIRLCKTPGITAAQLRESLKRPVGKRGYIIILATLVLAGAGWAIYSIQQSRTSVETVGREGTVQLESKEIPPVMDNGVHRAENPATVAKSPEPAKEKSENTVDSQAAPVSYKKEIEAEIGQFFKDYDSAYSRAAKILEDPSSTEEELLEAYKKLVNTLTNSADNASRYFENKYPDIPRDDIWTAVNESAVWRRSHKSMEDMCARLAKRIQEKIRSAETVR